MTEPTDAEIIALVDETRTAEGSASGYILPISFARAVLAKWGTPPAVAGEPVAWLDPWTGAKVTTDYDAYGKHGIPLYTAPQPPPQPSPTPKADSQLALPKITAEDRSFLHYNPNTDDVVEWVCRYASAAITADRAARAPADSVTAPVGGATSKNPLQVQVWVIPDGNGGGQFSWEKQDERYWTRLTPPAQAADGVLEDAARLLESQHTWLTNVAAANLLRSLAARKKGENHD